MRKVWHGIDLHLVSVPGDGQCCFRAIGMRVGLEWQDVRGSLARHAIRAWDDIWAWDQRMHLPAFLRNTTDHTVWGNAWHLGVAASLYQATIIVFIANGAPLQFGEGPWTWFLRYTTNQDGSGGHYDCYKVVLRTPGKRFSHQNSGAGICNGIEEDIGDMV